MLNYTKIFYLPFSSHHLSKIIEQVRAPSIVLMFAEEDLGSLNTFVKHRDSSSAILSCNPLPVFYIVSLEPSGL